jgi:hypothetical protein
MTDVREVLKKEKVFLELRMGNDEKSKAFLLSTNFEKGAVLYREKCYT